MNRSEQIITLSITTKTTLFKCSKKRSRFQLLNVLSVQDQITDRPRVRALQFRNTRETEPATELAEQEPCEGTEDEPAETVEDVGVALLRLHDVHGLCGDVVVLIVGHDLSLLGLIACFDVATALRRRHG